METQGYVYHGNSDTYIRVSPTLSVMEEACNERITKSAAGTKINCFHFTR